MLLFTVNRLGGVAGVGKFLDGSGGGSGCIFWHFLPSKMRACAPFDGGFPSILRILFFQYFLPLGSFASCSTSKMRQKRVLYDLKNVPKMPNKFKLYYEPVLPNPLAQTFGIYQERITLL